MVNTNKNQITPVKQTPTFKAPVVKKKAESSSSDSSSEDEKPSKPTVVAKKPTQTVQSVLPKKGE